MMPTPYTTLYHVGTLPKWSESIVEYLKTGTISESITRHRQRSVQVDAVTYTLLGEQLYKKGKDGNLLLCINETEYIPILQQAYEGIGSEHFSGDTTTRNILWYGLW